MNNKSFKRNLLEYRQNLISSESKEYKNFINKNYNDNLILSEDLKSFLNIKKDEESYKVICKKFIDYINENKLFHNEIIILDNKIKKILDISESKITIYKFYQFINNITILKPQLL